MITFPNSLLKVFLYDQIKGSWLSAIGTERGSVKDNL